MSLRIFTTLHSQSAATLLALLVVCTLAACQTAGGGKTVTFDNLHKTPKTLEGVLALPKQGAGPFPAVILLHGTAGPDNRYDFHRAALLKAGIATFQVDFKSGVFTDASDRPSSSTFDPFTYAALRELRKNPAIDPNRIALMGFSLGGHLSLRLANENPRRGWLDEGEVGFAAHVGFYPGCKWLNGRFSVLAKPTGAPILILTGELDSYGDGKSCGPFVEKLNKITPGVASVKIYPGVYHGFDRGGSWSGYDPAAIKQVAILKHDSAAAEDSRRRAVNFLRRVFGLTEAGS